MSTNLGERIVDAVFACVDRQKIQGHPNALSRSVLRPLLAQEVNNLLADASHSTANGVSSPDRIYALYPRHVGKKSALKAIERAIKAVGADPTWNQLTYISPAQFVESRTTAFAEAVKKWPPNERQFIPHPATWFNQGRYADDPKEWERGKPTNGEPPNYSRFL